MNTCRGTFHGLSCTTWLSSIMWLAFVFLFGFAACYPYGSPKEASDDAILAFVADVQDALAMPYAEYDDDGTKTELGKKLKEELDRILEKIKDAVDKGEEVKENLKAKLKEIKGKLRDLKEDFGNKAREIIEKIKEKAKDKLREWLEKLGLDKKSGNEFAYAEFDDDEPKTELGKKLREQFDNLLEKIRDAVDKGKVIKEEWREKLKDLKEKLKDLKEDIGTKAREILQKIKDRVKNKLKELLEKLGLNKDNDDEFAYAEFDENDDTKTELGQKLKESLDHILEKIKEAVEHGKVIRGDLVEKAKEIRQKLKDLKIDIGNKARELFDKIKNKARDFLKKLLERLGLDSQDDTTDDIFAYAEFDDDEEPKKEVIEKLKEHLDHILEKMKEALDKGKVIKDDVFDKIKEIRQKLRDLHVDMGKKARELLDRIKEKSKDFLRKLLERLGLKDITDEEIAYTEFDEEDPDQLKKSFDDILEKIRDAIEKGKHVKVELLKKFQELKEKLKTLKIDFGDKAREILKSLKEKFSKWLRELFNKEFSDTYDDIELNAVLRGIFHMIESEASTEDIEEYIKQELRDSPLGEALLQTLRQGRKPLKQVVKVLLGIRDSRSISDLYEKIKDYVKGLKEKFRNFLDWVKETYSKGKEASKDKIENLKNVAREFIDHAKNVKKEVAEEALEFFRPYKHDLGQLWEEVKKTVREAIGH